MQLPSMSERSQAVFPAGSNGEFNLPPELTIVLDRGAGCRVWDSDDREYLDFSMGWGSVLVGHAQSDVVAAVTQQVPRGSNFAYINTNALNVGERILRLSPACEALRFCASGTEATMYCQRLARAFRGRSKILKFEGAYHGANDVGVTSLFPSAAPDYPRPDPSSAGIRHGVQDDVLVAPFNDLEYARELIARESDALAAVIVEPLQRCVPPRAGFLEGLREVTATHDVPLIFDEVVTGFRLALGGAQEYYGVVPDLVAYGKALGGGYPIGAFGGRRDIMDLVREDQLGQSGYVWVASTLGGNPISTAAAGAALDVFSRENVYPRLHALGRYLRTGLARVMAQRDLPAQVIGEGPLAQVVFTTEAVHDYRTTQSGNRALQRALMLELFARRVFLNPMGTKLYLSLAHDESVCDEFLQRFAAALDRVAN
jgi:glutamate-1-semialdehyde 2,1-aminomutase